MDEGRECPERAQLRRSRCRWPPTDGSLSGFTSGWDSTDTEEVECCVLERRGDAVLIAVPPSSEGASVASDAPTFTVAIEVREPVALAVIRVPSLSVRALPMP